MRYLYDLHIHSALSPCADREMTPVNIVAYAAAAGLEIIAVSDHNAAGNVRAAVEVGEALDVLAGLQATNLHLPQGAVSLSE